MKKLNEKLRAKLSKSGGFTLVEMLIVVAIIAILIAVSIPMFNTTLEKARHGVDAANIRNVISMGTTEAIASLDPDEEFGSGKTFNYVVDEDSHQGVLVEVTAGGNNNGVKAECASASSLEGLQVKVTYDKTATDPDKRIVVTPNWEINTTTGHTEKNTSF